MSGKKYLIGIIYKLLDVLISYIHHKITTGVCVSSRHLVGKVVLVTGGTSGIGYETAADLAERGARVLIASNERHGDSVRDTIVARSGNTDVHFIYLDLASLDSVRSVAEKILSTEKRLDVLINNAGVLFTPNMKSDDGISLGMQINYFGPFLLTNLLLPLITQSSPSRIINVSSTAYKYGLVDLDNLIEPRTGCFPSFYLYCDSKLCVALMTVELARRLQGTGVTANFLHPGCSRSNIVNHVPITLISVLVFIFGKFVKTPCEAAQTSIYLAVSPDVQNVSGCYFEECRVKEINKKASNKDLATNLWCMSEKVVGI
ncbi:retinol dehydrogenase 14-like [Aricia agestis]|uniref:retinol dehydrogenase 14-like n=1 Tax=Aricia agestis TaxID=91739 RepID=UPI001C20388E|nr:retinol dehydrogenase 14-like [Aricia agestis]